MDKLDRILTRVLAKQAVGSRLLEARARKALLEVLGESLAGGCEVHLRRGILQVGTPNPALAHQLRIDQADLLDRLNLVLGGSGRLKQIRVRVGHSGGGSRAGD